MSRKYLTVSAEVHRKLAKFAAGGLDDCDTIFNADGTVSFPVTDKVLLALAQIAPEPELALRRILQMKVDA
jgi:hypothetical protein